MSYADPEQRRKFNRERMRRKRAAERAAREAAGAAETPGQATVTGTAPVAGPPPPPPEPLEPDGEVPAADDIDLARTLWRRIVKDPGAGETNRIRAAYHLEQSRKSGTDNAPATPAKPDWYTH